MIRCLMGRTGCGKTYTVIEEIKKLLSDGKQKIFLFVPEQQLYSAERDLLSVIPPDEADGLSVISFTRLCDLLEDIYGGRAHASLSRATSALLMWQNLRELCGLLETYGTAPSGDIALTRLMLETAKELSANGISPTRLEGVANTLERESPLACKLRDISLVMASYTHMIEDMCGKNPSDRLIRAAEQVRAHGYFQDAIIYIDSFTSFTAQEYALLTPMLSQASEVVFTLGMDQSTEPQFDSIRDTYRRLCGLARGLGCEVRTDHLTENHRAVSEELAVLERSLWNFSVAPQKIPGEAQGHIHLVDAPTPYDEAEAAALHILSLTEAGIPFGEIAVVVRDANHWKGILDAALEQYHIPFFLSERTDLNTKPAARLLLLALRCISRRWQSADILSLCKTGLCGIDHRDLDYFEEYVDMWRLSGRRMTEGPWSMNPDGYTTQISARGYEILDAANRVRETVMVPLLALDVKLKSAESLSAQCQALYEYLCDLKVRKQLSAQAETLLSLGNVREAGEAVRLWSFLTESLAMISTALPEDCEVMTAEELSGALSIVFSETDIGSVPARHDCVTVGSADTLRVDHIKAMLLLGLSEGEFPRAVSLGGLLSEQDKSALADCGVELTSREDILSSEELLYIYRAMTKPSEQLFLSHSLSRSDGQRLSPSAAFTRVAYLFPHLSTIHYAPQLLGLANETPYSPPMEDRLPAPRVYALLGEEIWLSRSKLRRYAQCPYSYFGAYTLRLREKTYAKIDSSISGTFLHHVLEEFLRSSMDEHGRLKQIDSLAMEQTANRIIEAYIRSLCEGHDIEDNGRLLHTFDRLRAIVLVLIQSILDELSQASFLPVGFEWDTHGYHSEDPSPLILPLREDTQTEEATEEDGLPVGIHKGASVKLKMGGVVDRVDVYRTEDGSRAYIRVVDYKSSRHELTEKTLTEDMDIQLLLYLFTLCSEKNRRLFADENGRIPQAVLPAQAMYFSPKEDTADGQILPVRSGLILEDEEVLRAASREINPQFLPAGIKCTKDGRLAGNALCSFERMEALEKLLYQTIREQAQALYSGNACRTPSSDGCNFCSMREGCPVAAEKPRIKM